MIPYKYKKVIQKLRGTTHITEFGESFKTKRFFYIEDVDAGTSRGNHANKHTNQILICTGGSISVTIMSNNQFFAVKILKPGELVFLPKMHWVEMRFIEPNSTLLVLADRQYDPNEYITNFNEFLQHANT